MTRAAVFAVVLLMAFAAFVLASGALPAQAHDFWINHSGYKSPADGTHCCGKNDCSIVPADDIQFIGTGWLIISTGETIPLSEGQISEDSDYWRCKRYDGSRRCFFYPPGNS